METSARWFGRIVVIVAVVAAVACSWLPSIQTLANEQVDAGLKRALLSFREFNMAVTPVPANFKTWDREYGWADYLPGGLGTSMTACREYVGLLYHKLLSIPRLVLHK